MRFVFRRTLSALQKALTKMQPRLDHPVNYFYAPSRVQLENLTMTIEQVLLWVALSSGTNASLQCSDASLLLISEYAWFMSIYPETPARL